MFPGMTDVMLAVGILFLASNMTFRQIGDCFGIAKSTARKYFRLAIEAILETFQYRAEDPVIRCAQMPHNYSLVRDPRWLRWCGADRFPNSPEGWSQVTREFEVACKITCAVGAIDGTFIKVSSNSVPAEERIRHLNRKGFISLIVQAVVDQNRQFMDVDCRTPGAQGDWNAFLASPLHRLYSATRNPLPEGHFLLADSGYFYHPLLLTPYARQQDYTREQRNFNYVHSRGRVVVEDAFGILKQRFPRLGDGGTIHCPPAFVPKIVIAACVLHNLVRRESNFMAPARETNPHKQYVSECFNVIISCAHRTV
jgi:hypothetical protein